MEERIPEVTMPSALAVDVACSTVGLISSATPAQYSYKCTSSFAMVACPSSVENLGKFLDGMRGRTYEGFTECRILNHHRAPRWAAKLRGQAPGLRVFDGDGVTTV
jgi:hypothetical protein